MDTVAIVAMDIHEKFSKAVAMDGKQRVLDEWRIEHGDRVHLPGGDWGAGTFCQRPGPGRVRRDPAAGPRERRKGLRQAYQSFPQPASAVGRPGGGLGGHPQEPAHEVAALAGQGEKPPPGRQGPARLRQTVAGTGAPVVDSRRNVSGEPATPSGVVAPDAPVSRVSSEPGQPVAPMRPSRLSGTRQICNCGRPRRIRQSRHRRRMDRYSQDETCPAVEAINHALLEKEKQHEGRETMT